VSGWKGDPANAAISPNTDTSAATRANVTRSRARTERIVKLFAEARADGFCYSDALDEVAEIEVIDRRSVQRHLARAKELGLL
jgi:hypothetical protein